MGVQADVAYSDQFPVRGPLNIILPETEIQTLG
jgi:hypothetical protein